MLMNKLSDPNRDINGQLEAATPISAIPSHLPAANAGNIAKSDMQARRERRQRRVERHVLRNISGWSVRSW